MIKRVKIALVAGLLLGQSALSNSLAEEAPPTAIAPPALSAYGQLPGIEHAALSLSGKYLTLVTHLDERRVVLVLEVGGSVLQKIGLGDVKLRDLSWAGDDHVIITTSSTQNLGMVYGGRHELFNFMVVDRRDGGIDWPLSGSKKVLNAAFGYHQPVRDDKGRWHQCVDTLPTNSSVHSGAVWIQNAEFDLTCIELSSGKRRVLAQGMKDGAGWLLAGELDVLAHATYDAVHQRWRLWSGGKYVGRGAPVLEAASRYGGYRIAGQGRDKGTAIISGGCHLAIGAAGGCSA